MANAVLDGADCVMLSGETAKGSYPIEAVRTMHEICKLAETVICYPAVFNDLRSLTALPTETTETVACAAVAAAHEQSAGCIIVLSTSGKSARLISKYRPRAPIVVVTRNPQTARQIHFYRGCFPFHYPKASSTAAGLLSPSTALNSTLSPSDNAPWQEDVDSRLKWGKLIRVFHVLNKIITLTLFLSFSFLPFRFGTSYEIWVNKKKQKRHFFVLTFMFY